MPKAKDARLFYRRQKPTDIRLPSSNPRKMAVSKVATEAMYHRSDEERNKAFNSLAEHRITMGLGLFGNAKASDCVKQTKSLAVNKRRSSHKCNSNLESESNSDCSESHRLLYGDNSANAKQTLMNRSKNRTPLREIPSAQFMCLSADSVHSNKAMEAARPRFNSTPDSNQPAAFSPSTPNLAAVQRYLAKNTVEKFATRIAQYEEDLKNFFTPLLSSVSDLHMSSPRSLSHTTPRPLPNTSNDQRHSSVKQATSLKIENSGAKLPRMILEEQAGSVNPNTSSAGGQLASVNRAQMLSSTAQHADFSKLACTGNNVSMDADNDSPLTAFQLLRRNEEIASSQSQDWSEPAAQPANDVARMLHNNAGFGQSTSRTAEDGNHWLLLASVSHAPIGQGQGYAANSAHGYFATSMMPNNLPVNALNLGLQPFEVARQQFAIVGDSCRYYSNVHRDPYQQQYRGAERIAAAALPPPAILSPWQQHDGDDDIWAHTGYEYQEHETSAATGYHEGVLPARPRSRNNRASKTICEEFSPPLMLPHRLF